LVHAKISFYRSKVNTYGISDYGPYMYIHEWFLSVLGLMLYAQCNGRGWVGFDTQFSSSFCMY